jgi:hypothetical protein
MAYEPYHGGGSSGYQEYPEHLRQPRRQPPPMPGSVASAVRAMYAGAGVSAISVIIGLAVSGSASSEIRRAHPNLTPSQVSAYAHLNLVSVIVVGLIGIGLWIWLARKCQQGMNWARVTGTVLFGIDTVLQVFGFTQPITFVARIPGLVIWLVGLAAVALLWRPDAASFFRGPAPGERW